MASIFMGAVLVLCLHAAYYYPFLSDDSLISLRYVDRLLSGEGLTWTEGQPVEGYSNLLWMLLIAVPGLAGVDLIDASRALGLAAMGIVVYALLHWRCVSRTTPESHLPAVVGLFFFCMAAPVAVWAIGGLEQPLYAALIALSIPMTIRVLESENPRKKLLLSLSLVLGLICLTRPDGPLFCAAAILSINLGRLASGKRAFPVAESAMVASLPLLFYGGQTIFRFAYYGELVPNTALVKIAPGIHHFTEGAKYLMSGMVALFPFSLIAVGFIITSIFSPQRRTTGIPLLILCALWTPYVLFIGGDIFPAHRHFIPLIVAFAFALVEGTEWILTKLRRSLIPIERVWLVGAVGIVCVLYSGFQFAHPTNRRAVWERWEWDGQVVGLLLRDAFSRQQPLVAVTAAGCIPYWSGLPALDMLGLNDYYLPRNPPEDFGEGRIGHELGDGRYVLRRQPDIIVFHTGNREAVFRSGKELWQMQEFHDRYAPVNVRGRYPRDHTATLWFYRSSPAIGIERTHSRISVPGFFLNGDPRTVAYPNGAGELVVSIHSGQSASVTIDVPPPLGKWSVEVKASRAGAVRSELRATGAAVTVALSTPSDEPVEIEEVVLTRM